MPPGPSPLHAAVTDNALQLGPATGDVGKEDDADVTRVVAGMAAYCPAEDVPQLGNAWTATERAPMASDGSIYTCHYLLTPGGSRCLHIRWAASLCIEGKGGPGHAPS